MVPTLGLKYVSKTYFGALEIEAFLALGYLDLPGRVQAGFHEICTGLLLGNVSSVTTVQKPLYFGTVYIPMMVTLIQLLNSNPVHGGSRVISEAVSDIYLATLRECMRMCFLLC